MAKKDTIMASGRDPKRTKATFVGGGIGSLAGAAFLIRDGGLSGGGITILEELPLAGGSCDGIGSPDRGYVIRGGRMLNLPTYECTWELFKEIPSLAAPGKTVYEEILDFNGRIKTDARARLVTADRQKVDVRSMGFSRRDRMELLRLTRADEDAMGDSRISDWFSPPFFETNFWYLWATTFAFQTWHSAAELRRYMIRFMHEFPRIHNLAGVARTPYNQYDSLVRPLEAWLRERGVDFVFGCRVTDLDLAKEGGEWVVKGILCERSGASERIDVAEGDLVFVQNGCITDASSLGSMTSAPAPRTKRTQAPGSSGRSSRRDGPSSATPPPSAIGSRSRPGSLSP